MADQLETYLLIVLIISVIISTGINLYLVYRNTVLVCGDYTLQLYKILQYQTPLECGQCQQTCRINNTIKGLNQIKTLIS